MDWLTCCFWPRVEPLPTLPADCQTEVLKQMDLVGLGQASRVCKKWAEVSKEFLVKGLQSGRFINEFACRSLRHLPPTPRWSLATDTQRITSIVLTPKHLLGLDAFSQELRAFDGHEGTPVEIKGNRKIFGLGLNEGPPSAIDGITGEEIGLSWEGGPIQLTEGPRELRGTEYRAAWNLGDGKYALSLSSPDGPQRILANTPSVNSLVWWRFEQGHLIARLGREIHVWECASKRHERLIQNTGSHQLMMKGGHLWGCSSKGGLKVWDITTCEVRLLDPTVSLLFAARDSSKLVGITGKNEIQLWDAKTKACNRKWAGGKDTLIAATLLGEDTVITGDKYGTVTFWRAGKALQSFVPFKQTIVGLQYAGGRLLITTTEQRALFDLLPSHLRAKIV